MRYYSSHKEIKNGDGLLNSLINKLPFELHIPGYNFCGPGTKLKKRLERGDVGINPLDEACKKHDIEYSKTKELPGRHEADRILLKNALERLRASNASWSEKLAALGISTAMHSKLKLGMGSGGGGRGLINKLKKNHKNNQSRQTVIIMQKIVEVTRNYLKEMTSLLKSVNKIQKT